jgi:type 2 lantibiotic biosynthesis protein LanM
MAVQVAASTNRTPNSQASWPRALTLRERREPAPGATGVDHADADRRMQRWRLHKPFGDPRFLAEWLEAQSLSADELWALLGESSDDLRCRVGCLPPWFDALTREAGAGGDTSAGSRIQTTSAGAANILDMLAPVIGRQVTRLRHGLATLSRQHWPAPFDPATIEPYLMSNLAAQLLPCLSRTLALELNVARLQERLHGDSPEARFADFIRQLSEGAIWPLLEEYPVLARQVVLQTEQWVTVSLELLARLCHDWPQIVSTFAAGAAPGPLVEIRGGAGDTHRQGRSVLRLVFGGGLQLMYKPRALALDVHFNEMLAWLNGRGVAAPFRLTRVVDRGDYGWMEFVAAESCRTAAEVERFYERQGGYLALLYLLHATDFHFENLIAAGEHPVLIDLEALFHAPLATAPDAHLEDPAIDVLASSVLITGLLPQRAFGDADHAGIDVSGLNGQAGQLSPRPVLRWQNTGTDTMHAVRERLELSGQHNRPRLDGRDVSLLDYARHLHDGFARVYRLVMQHRDALIAGPLAAFSGDRVRVLLRPTNAYARLLQESHHPDLLRDALDRERVFAMLWGERTRLGRLIHSEVEDLWNGDIPMFSARPDSRDVHGSRGECIADMLAASGLDMAAARIRAMNDIDLARQLWIVDASLASTPRGEGRAYWRSSRTPGSRPPVSRTTLLHAARMVGDRLCQLAVHGADAANWVTLSIATGRQWSVSTTGPDLYDGLPGIVLTLAYLGQVTGGDRYTALAHAGLRTLRRMTTAPVGRPALIGAFTGWGSLVYLYSHLAVLWRDESLFGDARSAAGHVEQCVERDDALDIMGGSAGAILALLALLRAAPSASILAIAEQCGRHLVARAQPMAAGAGWTNTHTGSVPLAGFSHGAAGIAYSLLALGAATGDDTFGDTARQGIAYERSLYSAGHRNWPALLEPIGDEGRYRATWCHGASGIGLGRLAGSAYWHDETATDEIEIALRSTLECGFGLNHSLCHGDLGNLELLLSVALAMPASDHEAQLNAHVAHAVESIERLGYLSGTPLGVETPGLMTGIAGIGYQLLRLAEPDRVPAVLCLAPPGGQA